MDRVNTHQQCALRGRVVSGRGVASKRLRHQSWGDAVHRITCEPIFPGTLNVVLDQPLRLNQTVAQVFDDNSVRALWPARLNNMNVWVYRWGNAQLHQIEVIASVNLKRHFELGDGDPILIIFSPDQVGRTKLFERLAWRVLWQGRQAWCYSSGSYYRFASKASHAAGAIQLRKEKEVRKLARQKIKQLIKKMPVIGPISRKVNTVLGRSRQKYEFVRVNTNKISSRDDLHFTQIKNILAYTKTSNSVYNAMEFPAGYHTIQIGERKLIGQRDPSIRLGSVPIDFEGKSILDIGCNQGGMLYAVSSKARWGVGIDYDFRMINAANRIKREVGAHNLDFYVFNLEREQLDLIQDLLPDGKVDIAFLLSVCMWINNWREVIDFTQTISSALLFESNGTDDLQSKQIAYLRGRYATVTALAEQSLDDTRQKNRKLFYCTNYAES